jgi:hypothetical protein
VARRGRYPPRVQEYWHLLMLMQGHINEGATPYAAAKLVARTHWRETQSASLEACEQWLKRNQRAFSRDLQSYIELEKSKDIASARKMYEALTAALDAPPRDTDPDARRERMNSWLQGWQELMEFAEDLAKRS